MGQKALLGVGVLLALRARLTKSPSATGFDTGQAHKQATITTVTENVKQERPIGECSKSIGVVHS